MDKLASVTPVTQLPQTTKGEKSDGKKPVVIASSVVVHLNHNYPYEDGYGHLSDVKYGNRSQNPGDRFRRS